jgi:hypothetical protein
MNSPLSLKEREKETTKMNNDPSRKIKKQMKTGRQSKLFI